MSRQPYPSDRINEPPPELARPFMCTLTGQKVFLDAPDPASIRLEDIAGSLGRQCRYNGHTPGFYSVAEHSLLVANCLPPELRLHGLLHDAAEAYFGDIISPVKKLAGHAIRELEKRLMLAIYAGLDLPVHLPQHGHCLPRLAVQRIQWADLAVGAEECRQFGIAITTGREPNPPLRTADFGDAFAPCDPAPPLKINFYDPSEASGRWFVETQRALEAPCPVPLSGGQEYQSYFARRSA